MRLARRFSAHRQPVKIIASLNSDGTVQYTNRISEIASLWLLKEIIGQGKPQGLRLVGLLQQTLAFQATDPRDKVFALVGLSHGVDPDFIDYKLNMHEVFIRTVRFVIRDNAATALQILSLVRGHDRGVLPSWVPDWTQSLYGQSPS